MEKLHLIRLMAMMDCQVIPDTFKPLLEKYLANSTDDKSIGRLVQWSLERRNVDLFVTIIEHARVLDRLSVIVNGDYDAGRRNNTCLHKAVLSPDESTFVERLLEAGADPWKVDAEACLPIERILQTTNDQQFAFHKFEMLLSAMKPKFQERIEQTKSIFRATVCNFPIDWILLLESQGIGFEWEFYYKTMAECAFRVDVQVMQHLMWRIQDILGRIVIATDIEHNKELKSIGSPLDILFEYRPEQVDFIDQIIEAGYESWKLEFNFNKISFYIHCEDSLDYGKNRSILQHLLASVGRKYARQSVSSFELYRKRNIENHFWGGFSNLLTVALTLHCGWTAKMAAAECPEVDTVHLASHFHYSRHTGRLLRHLFESHELSLNFLGRDATVDLFRSRCSPLEPSVRWFHEMFSIQNVQSVHQANLASFDEFCDWLEEFQSQPATLARLTLNHFYRLAKSIRGHHQAEYEKRREYLRANIPKSAFDYIFFNYTE